MNLDFSDDQKLLQEEAKKFLTKEDALKINRAIMDSDKKLFFYEWHVSKGNEKNCLSCWFTTAVSMPFDQGNSI